MGPAICALLTALQATAPPPSDVTELQTAAWTTVGARIPDLELPLIDGSGTFDLASLRGKKVLLVQFASW
ncbi:MAG: hypothetical protein AAF957_11935 [Planctomycetota bacterium]